MLRLSSVSFSCSSSCLWFLLTYAHCRQLITSLPRHGYRVLSMLTKLANFPHACLHNSFSRINKCKECHAVLLVNCLDLEMMQTFRDAMMMGIPLMSRRTHLRKFLFLITILGITILQRITVRQQRVYDVYIMKKQEVDRARCCIPMCQHRGSALKQSQPCQYAMRCSFAGYEVIQG